MPENFLRGTAIIKVVDDGLSTSGIPSTLKRIYSIVGNVDSASSEVHQNLV